MWCIICNIFLSLIHLIPFLSIGLHVLTQGCAIYYGDCVLRSLARKVPPLLALYAVALLMAFLMAADGRREPLALGLGVQHSFNKSQSVLCHYINIFGQLLWRSGGDRSMWAQEKHLVLRKPQKKNKLKGKMDTEKKCHKRTCIPAGVLIIRDILSLIIYWLQRVLPVNRVEGKDGYTQWNLQPFSSCENEIQEHKDNTQLWLRPFVAWV